MAQYVTRDEYVESRRVQDDLLRREFATIHQKTNDVDAKVDRVDAKVDRLAAKVDGLSAKVDRVDVKVDRVDAKVDRVEAKFDKLTSDLRTDFDRLYGLLRNGRLRNPILPIYPVVRQDEATGSAIHPDPGLFPRNAREFYNLREPTTERRQKMLLYLTSFYDIHITANDSDLSEGEQDTDNSKRDEAILQEGERIVSDLEGILGLDELNFIMFEERAQKMGAQPAGSKKRIRLISNNSESPPEQPLQKRKLGIRLRDVDDSSTGSKSKPSLKSEQLERLEWRHGDRSTPSSQMVTINNLRAARRAEAKAQPSSPHGDEQALDEPRTGSSQTRPNSTPRESRIQPERFTPED